MKIIIDAMGGDNAPMEIVKGTIKALDEYGTDIILVGRGEEILRCIESMGMKNIPKGIEISHTPDVVMMEDDPASVIREKKDSSLVVALNLLKEGSGDAMLSAGSTGALLSGATLLVKRIKGIRRAALAPVLPNGCIIIDSGANIDCTAEYLLQFAYMGASYSKNVLSIAKPRVALLNIGQEESKGLPLQKETYKLLREASDAGKINFTGNIEGRDVFTGLADVIVCDGFSGNILLKSMEGVGLYLNKALKEIFSKNIKTKLAASLVMSDLMSFRKQMDYTEVGGSVLIGISKPVVKAHGSSDANAIKNAIGQAVTMVSSRFISEIEEHIEDMKIGS